MKSSKRTLSYLVFRSAFMGQTFAMVSLTIIVLASFVFSALREQKQICDKATFAWATNQEKIMELLMLDQTRGTELKLKQILEEGGWTKVSIAPAGKTAKFRSISVGNEQGLIHSCKAPFSYLGQLQGAYTFEYPWKSFGNEAIKFLFALFVALCGLLFVVLLQGKVLRRSILNPIDEIQRNLKSLTAEAPDISFSEEAMCDELRELQSSIEIAFEKNKKLHHDLENKKISDEINRVSVQLAHDIRSPLTSLDMILEDLNQLPEEKRLQIRNAVSRIRDIANTLLKKTRETTTIKTLETAPRGFLADQVSTQLISPLIESLVSEKRLQYRNRMHIDIESQLDKNSYGHFIKVDPNEFKVVLSNLIDNSVEAISSSGKVSVSVSANPVYVNILIEDNGKGIPEHILPQLGKLGETHGKESGFGLGLYHARSKIEHWGGRLEIKSQVAAGTKITITLPRVTPPTWFVPRIELRPYSTIVVLDDDTSIHEVWKSKFNLLLSKEPELKLIHLATPSELKGWVASNGNVSQEITYLVDFELKGQRETGLELIKDLNLHRQAILVTSHFEEKSILDECSRNSIRLIPKGMAGFVPVSMSDRKAG